MPKLELLVLTMPSRSAFLSDLLASLEPQCFGHSAGVLVRMCDPAFTLGENRDMLLRSSGAEYVCFVDDDDKISPQYVAQIMPHLDGVDYVGFDLQCYIDGTALPKVTHHALKYGNWYEDENGYYRDISHINPMRRELALLESFEGGNGEDERWAGRMRARQVLKTEHVIDKVLYRYYFRTRKNIGKPCPECRSTSTVLVETGTHCNGCGILFDPAALRKSCLWM
jgi:hypothetical protein